ncbi:MAG: aminotransferase class III-fold pyridoxal phosphate-dependent enzyme [Chloroflexota bacterium]|nr:aminotransferase class III-fold pyridoxal phosphate-dependent enzyme [Chloroflexota bacterium]
MTDRYRESRAQHGRAKRSLAGGLGSSYRGGQLPVPISFAQGQGSHLVDIDGNDYVDYGLAFGPMLLGHSPAVVLDAVRRQLDAGIGYGAPHRMEAELAEAVCRTVPCAERVIFSSTGSEAVHVALRIARAATGRNRVVKFLGHFHGWLDPLHIGTPGHDPREPGTAGQDPDASAAVTVCPWNDIEALRACIGPDVAAVIMEPFAQNGGCFAPAEGYLQAVRTLTRDAGALLIFDEVITGFRMALGGAQEHYGVTPDLAVFAKALGSGFPISAVCGRADVMEVVASGQVAHAGTLNTNPVSTAAALATVTELERRAGELYPRLARLGAGLACALRDAAAEQALPLQVNQHGGMAYAFWSEQPVRSFADARQTDVAGYRRFAAALLDQGVHVISRGLLYVSFAHTDADLARTAEAAHAAARTLSRSEAVSSPGG